MKIIAKTVVYAAYSGFMKYFHYRMPALAVAANGHVLAFCEGRTASSGDEGCEKVDIVLKTSCNGGLNWGNWETIYTVASDGYNTVGNPCPIVDSKTGTICLVFCKHTGGDRKTQIVSGEKPPRSIWKTFSSNNGYTWTEPEEITAQTRLENWTWYETGPCHGIETKSGRYIVPCCHAELDNTPQDTTRSHVIYSDDKGLNWHIGGVADWRTNEACIAETSAGLYMNMRSNKFGSTRAYAVSKDNGLTFGDCKYTDELIDPYCQGSIFAYGNGLIFCNASSERKRVNLSLKHSSDLWRSWKDSLVLDESFAGYSDIAVDKNGNLLVLHEGTGKVPIGTIYLSIIDPEHKA